MGIFNEQSNHSFARGIQGAPRVGFSLTADGNYDMLKRKLTNQTKHQINPMLIQQQQIQ